jgi:biopolymer transport protein ExbB/TolQ
MERDLSILGLLSTADPVVKGIMLILAISSVVCWAIAFEKLIRVVAFSRQISNLEKYVAAHGCMEKQQRWFLKRLLTLAAAEPDSKGESRADFCARLERSLQTEGSSQFQRLQSGLPFLATVGSTAPFVGLFGTVWGIMHSFTGIAAAKDTSLAVVAPGIAEALFATAVGLVAAIPAVIFYNQANVALSRMTERLSVAIARFAKIKVYGSPAVHFERVEADTMERHVLTNGGMDAR